jgi:hypothetical protein
LAARLTGWRIDIVSESEFARTEAEAAFGGEDEEFSGRCAAILSTGKRCPNTSLPGSRYCGIPAHRELAAKEEAGEKLDPSVAAPRAGEVAEEAEAVGAGQASPEAADESAATADAAPQEPEQGRG